MKIKVIKKEIESIFKEIKKETPVIIFKSFLKQSDCKKIVSVCHKNFSFKQHRKKKINNLFNFMSLDVLPSKVKSNRIFRSFELSPKFISKFKAIKEVIKFQNKIIKPKKNKKIFRKAQVIHYPKGGGFFEEHSHNRYPTNYGLIITLTKKNKDFKSGVTNFKLKNKNVNLENYGVTIGDLVLFRFDLAHSVTACDPKEDLIFDKNGRWTLVFPVYHNKF